MGSAVSAWILVPEWTKPLQSMNDRLHWAAARKLTDRCKEWAMNAATEALIPPLQHCVVEMVWTVPDLKRRDAENPMPDFKAICDGLVNAGVVPDDIPKWMTKLMPRIEYVKGMSRVTIIITGDPVPVLDGVDDSGILFGMHTPTESDPTGVGIATAVLLQDMNAVEPLN